MDTHTLLRSYRDGDEHGWTTEFTWLWTHHRAHLLSLLDSVIHSGIQEPILVGDDGRVWDGHHRLAVAAALALPQVPVRLLGGAS